MKILTSEEKSALLAEFERPKVVQRTEEEISRRKRAYIQIVASFALENQEPSDFGKVVTMEEIRGELTEEEANKIISRILPDEIERIYKKITRLQELGLSWKDL